MFYAIQNNLILKAANKHALSNYYDNVKELPSDYQEGKYVVENGELVLNPNYEEELEQKELARVNSLTLDSSTFYKEVLRTYGRTISDIQTLIQSNNILSSTQKESLLIDLQKTFTFIRGSFFIITLGTLLNYTPEDLDYLFEHKVFNF